jgi:hypothetical protein
LFRTTANLSHKQIERPPAAIWRIILRDGSPLSVRSSPDVVSIRTPGRIGAIAQFEKTSLVAKLKAARDRKKGRWSYF